MSSASIACVLSLFNRAAPQLSVRARWSLLFALLSASLLTRSVRAQSADVWQPASPSSPRAPVLVVREDEAPRTEFALRVERALARSLSDFGLAVSQSPLPFRDAQLAAGCTGSVRECGGQVALALETEQLLVTAIEENPSGRYVALTLYRFASHTPARVGTAQLPREATPEMELTVYALVESLYADRAAKSALSTPALPSAARASTTQAEPALPEADAPESAHSQERAADAHRHTTLRAVGWPSLVLGAGLLVGGMVEGLASARESQASAALSPSSRDEVDTKLAHASKADDKAASARVLYGVGGAFAATGIFVLLWERFALRPDRKLQKASSMSRSLSALRISVAPSTRGLSLGWSAEL